MFLKSYNFSAIFRKLLGIEEDIFEGYFQNKYNLTKIITNREETKKLPLSKKLAQAINKHITEKTKKLDLDIIL